MAAELVPRPSHGSDSQRAGRRTGYLSVMRGAVMAATRSGAST
jgi:hypothetical protein